MFGRDDFAPGSEIISPKVKVEKSSSVKPSPNPPPEGEGNEKTLAEQTLDSPTMLMPFGRGSGRGPDVRYASHPPLTPPKGKGRRKPNAITRIMKSKDVKP